jgi:hypothetical protein
MKKFRTHLLNILLILSCISVSPELFAMSDEKEIWSFVFLIPIYFILILQSLLVLLALIMKQFKSKKLLLTTSSIASIVITIGIIVAFYFEPIIKLTSHLLYYFLIGIIVIALPIVQFKLLSKSGVNTEI